MLHIAPGIIYIATLLGVSFVSAAATIKPNFNCGTPHDSSTIAQVEAHFANVSKAGFTRRIEAESEVVVYWNVINVGNSSAQGNVPDAQIERQISVLNNDYRGMYRFTIGGIRRFSNRDWFFKAMPDSRQEFEMKRQLHYGGPNDLNIYSVGWDGTSLLGYSSFPSDYQARPYFDGVLIDYRTLPGGPAVKYNLGRVLTHEVGHWFGLYHTFEGGCFGPGDYVEDTVAEAEPASGCPVGRVSCPGSPGFDPVRNFMDYSDNTCSTGFTNGQRQRMINVSGWYRGL